MTGSIAKVSKGAVRIAGSHAALKWGVVLNGFAAAVAAAASNWPMLRDHLSPQWWLIGASILAALNVILHGIQAKRAAGGGQ